MARWWVCGLLWLLAVAAAAEGNAEPLIRLPTQEKVEAAPAPAPSAEEGVTRWAVLVAGSSSYGNYRHQVRLRRRLYPLRRALGLKICCQYVLFS